MSLRTERKRVGALDESNDLVLRHVTAIENVPFGSRLAVWLVALKFDKPHGEIRGSCNPGPFNVFPFVKVPVITFVAGEDYLPSLWWPGWWIFVRSGRIGVGHANGSNP
jgi:hypothetical protein